MNAQPAGRALPADPGAADVRPLAFVAELTETLALSLDLRPTLERALPRIAQYMQAEAASLFLLDAEGQVLECRVCVGPVNLVGLRLGLGQGIIGACVAENRVQLVTDAATDPRVHLSVDAETGFQTRSILCAPLATANGAIGALELVNRRDGLAFDAADAELLRALAAPTALAIHNTRLARELVEQQRLRREFDLARRLQKGLLPRRRRDGFPLLAVNLPAHEISGDFYDYFDLPDGRIGFVVGDVSGKGLDAALLMTRAASLLRWAGKDGLAPGEWLRRVNEELCQTTQDGRFVCALVGDYDRRTGRVVLAGAGFPPVLVHGPDGSYEIASDGPPLGILPGVEFGATALTLGSASLYAFSDGVTDVRVGAERLGAAGARALIERHAAAAPEQRLAAILSDLKRYRLVDDTTLLLLEEPRAHAAQVLLRESVPAQPEHLRTLRAGLRVVLDGAGLDPPQRDRLVLAVDEACCNIIRHAYGGGPGEIALSVTRDGEWLEFELKDTAAPVDPGRVKPRDLGECRAGGLGVNIIDAVMDDWRIAPLPGGRGNVLRMRKRHVRSVEEDE